MLNSYKDRSAGGRLSYLFSILSTLFLNLNPLLCQFVSILIFPGIFSYMGLFWQLSLPHCRVTYCCVKYVSVDQKNKMVPVRKSLVVFILRDCLFSLDEHK